MINRITYASLRSVLEENKWLLVSFEGYLERVDSGIIDLCEEIFNENEDYQLSSFVTGQESAFTRKTEIYINIYNRKTFILSKEQYYYKETYDLFFKILKIKVNKEHLQGLISIANGL